MDNQIPVIPSRQNQSQRSNSQTKEENKPWFREGISLKMTAKGKYYWDINAYGDLLPSLIYKIKEIDNALRQEFPDYARQEDIE